MSKPVLSLGFDVPFSEAIAWAKDRISILPDTYYTDLPAQARSRAFTISGLSALDQIQGVLDNLHKTLETGGTFAEWCKNLKPEVLALGNARLDNIFRTAIQTHYNIGRYEQQEANKAHRPYRMYDAINDGRTRPHHKALDNFIAPIDDPVWKKIMPPLGFRCRCSTISLTEAQAKQRGYKVGNLPPPDGRADDGWDYDKLNGQDEALNIIRATKIAKANQQLKHIAVKAIHESAVEKIKSLDQIISFGKSVTSAMPEDPIAAFDYLIGRMQADVGISTPCVITGKSKLAPLVKFASTRYPDSWTKAVDKLGAMKVKAMSPNSRGYYSPSANGEGVVAIRDSIGNAIHEYGHRLQHGLPDLDKLFQEFHTRRTAGDSLEKLSSVTGNRAYAASEVTRKDKYINPYQGKEYANGGALEMLTMGFESVLSVRKMNGFVDPRGLANFQEMLYKDREMFDFIVGVLTKWKP